MAASILPHPGTELGPSLKDIREAYEQGQRDAEQNWRMGPERWDFNDKECRAAYWLGFANPRNR